MLATMRNDASGCVRRATSANPATADSTTRSTPPSRTPWPGMTAPATFKAVMAAANARSTGQSSRPAGVHRLSFGVRTASA